MGLIETQVNFSSSVAGRVQDQIGIRSLPGYCCFFEPTYTCRRRIDIILPRDCCYPGSIVTCVAKLEVPSPHSRLELASIPTRTHNMTQPWTTCVDCSPEYISRYFLDPNGPRKQKNRHSHAFKRKSIDQKHTTMPPQIFDHPKPHSHPHKLFHDEIRIGYAAGLSSCGDRIWRSSRTLLINPGARSTVWCFA